MVFAQEVKIIQKKQKNQFAWFTWFADIPTAIVFVIGTMSTLIYPHKVIGPYIVAFDMLYWLFMTTTYLIAWVITKVMHKIRR